MSNNLEAIAGALAILLPLMAALVTGRKPKFGALSNNPIKPEAVNTNGGNGSMSPGLLLVQESQGTALRLLSTQVETLSNDVRRRFDELLLMLAEMRNGQDRRLMTVEESLAKLTQRVYALEQGGKEVIQ